MELSVTRPNPILKSEAHLHLYGCLDAEGLWTIGSDPARLNALEPRMEWFAAEYTKTFGIVPNWREWWKTSKGFDDFKQTFEFTKAGSFPEFQAKFNLLIALNPPRPGDYELVKRVLETHSKAGGIKEYRTFLPIYLPEPDREAYLLGLLEEVRNHTDKNRFQPLVALSFMRTPEVADESYGWLQQFCEKNPWVSSYITGVDFCASEVGHAPKWKQNFIARLYQDNFKREKPWHVLYHVGEMWDPISLASAARWVVEACALGARRLGHAMALGVDPNILLNQSTKEPRAEFLDHILWLTQHESLLEGFGYTPSDRKDWQTYGDRHL